MNPKILVVLLLFFTVGYITGGTIVWWSIQNDLSKGSINLITYKATGCKIDK